MEDKIKSRYNDKELQEFKSLINNKLTVTRGELNTLIASLQTENENGTDDTGSVYKTLEDGSSTLQKESTSQLASRFKKFIQNLEAALVRIENKTYGICRVTGKLIAKERLKSVPHTTQSMEAKINQYK
jgi:DnaK suppressor protein